MGNGTKLKQQRRPLEKVMPDKKLSIGGGIEIKYENGISMFIGPYPESRYSNSEIIGIVLNNIKKIKEDLEFMEKWLNDFAPC